MKRLLYSLLFVSCLCLIPYGCDLAPDKNVQPDDNKTSPIAVETGFRVLILAETKDTGKIPKEQLATLSSVPFRQWVESRVAKVPGTNDPDFHVLDPDDFFKYTGGKLKYWVDFANEHKPDSYPWLYVTDGKSYKSVKMPILVKDNEDLLTPFAGK